MTRVVGVTELLDGGPDQKGEIKRESNEVVRKSAWGPILGGEDRLIAGYPT